MACRNTVKLAGACVFKSANSCQRPIHVFVLNFWQNLIPDTTKHEEMEQGACHEIG